MLLTKDLNFSNYKRNEKVIIIGSREEGRRSARRKKKTGVGAILSTKNESTKILLGA